MAPSITSWARLEPRTRSSDLNAGLAARIADPVWLLGRQWQVGEFIGEDAGSPVSARTRLDIAPFTVYRPAAGPISAYDPTLPLEVAVERESSANALDPRHAAEAGQQFLRLLAAHQVGTVTAAYVAAMPFTIPDDVATDTANDRRLAIYAHRVPDGAQLARSFGPSPITELPAEPDIPTAQRAGVLAAANEWVSQYAGSVATSPAGSSAWLDDRMEYTFAIGGHDATGEIVLRAKEYDGGRLDWIDVDLDADDSLDAIESSTPTVRTLMPTAVMYAGMPSPRWWEREDTRINFGALDAEPTDLARMMLIEFATTYGNDHFVIPIEMPVGTTARISSLVVTNTFGEQTLIPPINGDDWTMFTLSGAARDGTAPILALMPTVADSLDGEALEEVLLLPDEMANVAWAVETHVAGPAGVPIDRHTMLAAAASPVSPPDGPELRYKLATPVPDNWLPLIPTDVEGQVRLVLSEQQRAENGGVVGIPPAGVLLAPDGLWLYPEEIPKAGARLTRGWQIARSPDGVIHLWLGRAKGVGRGPGSSGLRFDSV